MRLLRVALVVGHSEERQGSMSDSGISEYVYNRAIAEKISWLKLIGKYKNIYVRIFYRKDIHRSTTENLKELANRINEWGSDITLELHMNGFFDKTVSGHEVLLYHKANSRGLAFARILNNYLDYTFDGIDRGLKYIKANPRTKEGDRGWPLIYFCKSPVFLLEPFFATNRDDMEKGMRLGNQYSEAILEACKSIREKFF